MKSQALPISDVSEVIISVTDIKHYLYCPRIVYFEHVLHAKPMLGSQQLESREEHEDYVRKEIRRKGAIYYSREFEEAQKIIFPRLYSQRLGLHGIVDLIIKTKNGEYIPVEYKNTMSDHGRAWSDHKYQLTAYALLIDENFKTQVKRGFINYIPEEKVVRLQITEAMKTHTKRILQNIKKIIYQEKLPKIRVSRAKCTGGCGYKYICQ